MQEAYETLEQRVKERTAQLSELNESLAAEVETRKAVELNLKETQGELVHAGKMAVLGQISAGLAHELNQPLAALRTLADNSIVLLEQRRFDDTRANLQRIGHLVGRLGDTTRRLKGFAHKPPSGESAEPTPVAPAIASAQALLSERMRRQRVAFESAVEPETQVVMANPAALEQVMVNLIANAIDAMAGCPVKRLQVGARRVGEFVQIKVTDTGCGIAPEVMPRLFEAFATSKPRGTGLGLGLMISQRIAQDFRGCIRAANNPDGGATFIVEWPVARQPKAQ